MSTWKGISHARMTRSMAALGLAEYKVLAAVRRLIPDGERRKISHAEIADRANVSEGSVSKAMRDLSGIYFNRYFLGKGRGKGYEIEMLPPPEQQAAPPVSALTKGSADDPSLRSFESGDTTDQTPPEKGSPADPSIFLVHVHEQQQQRGGLPEGDYGQLDPEAVKVLKAENAHPKIIRKIAQANPTLTAQTIQENLARARLREIDGSADSARALTFGVLAVAQAVAPPRPKRPEDADAPPGAAPPLAGPPAGPRGRRAPEPPAATPHDEPDPIWALVRQLAPDAVPKERQLLAELILGGMPPDQALAELERERQEYVERMTMPRGARSALARLT